MDIEAPSRLGNGIVERHFRVVGANGPVPGLLWTQADTSGRAPLILMMHGGSGSKTTANMLDARDYFTGEKGIATAAIDGPAHGERGGVTSIFEPEYAEMWRRPQVVDDMNADWSSTLDALLALGVFDPAAIGWHGLSFGSMLGIPYLAGESRVAVAVLGLCGLRGPSVDRAGIAERLAADAPRITIPVLYHVQWDDERFDRDGALELYGLIGSADKRLQSTPGPHSGASVDARDTWRAFLVARLQTLHAGQRPVAV